VSDEMPPSLIEIDALARRELGRLPPRFRRELGPLVIRVEEFPDAATQEAMQLAHPDDLLGLYHGVALARRSVSFAAPYVDMVFLYRGAILAYCRHTGEPLAAVVRHVLIHEIGHHIGFSDADMARIERAG
jgi:predicted Zn-dependent protease with MMP-like domain